MSTILDTVVTLAIGRNLADGTPMADARWADFQTLCLEDMRYCTRLVVFSGNGSGLCSDGVHDGTPEESFVVIAINPRNHVYVELLREWIAAHLVEFGQVSAALAIDAHHTPVWATPNGERPVAAPVTAALYAPSHGGYSS